MTEVTEVRKKTVFFWIMLASVASVTSVTSVAHCAVKVTTTSVLAKAAEFESKIKQATFKFEEKFVLKVTSEVNKVKGRVYLDKKNSRVRVDYRGDVKAKVWIDEKDVYFADLGLEQVVIRRLDDFEKVHLQAFMDIPLIHGTKRFEKRFNFEITTMTRKSVELFATPASESPYRLRLRFKRDTGQPEGLDLILDNYEARLAISNFDPKAKIRESLFKKDFPEGYAILDLRNVKHAQ